MNEAYEMTMDEELAMEDAIQERMDEREQEERIALPLRSAALSYVLRRFNANLR